MLVLPIGGKKSNFQGLCADLPLGNKTGNWKTRSEAVGAAQERRPSDWTQDVFQRDRTCRWAGCGHTQVEKSTTPRFRARANGVEDTVMYRARKDQRDEGYGWPGYKRRGCGIPGATWRECFRESGVHTSCWIQMKWGEGLATCTRPVWAESQRAGDRTGWLDYVLSLFILLMC